MAEAVVEERQLLKTLRWYDGFVICLANPGFMLGSLGWSVLDLGGWGAALIWGLTALIVIPVIVIYSELAAMFPHKSGGVAIYANEGWRKYTTLVGPVATFGYWIGWSVVLSFIGLFAGYIAQTAWFPGEPYGTYAFGGAIIDRLLLDRVREHRAGPPDRDRPDPGGLGLQLLRHAGRRELQLPRGHPAHVPALLLHAPAVHQRRLHSDNLTYKLNDGGLAWGGLQMALVWIWIMIWSTAPEAAATFAPEYKDTGRDTRKALMSSALFILFVNTMVPIGLTGGVGAETVEVFDYVGALDELVGPNLTNFFVVVICASFVISMNTATADGSRALYGISKDGLTVKQLGRLNRWNVPGSAMTLDMVINILFVLFVGNLFGILVASNIGYVFANICAISAFILLRRDRPEWPRPIRLSSYWMPIAAVLCAAFIVFEVVGVGWFQIAGDGAVYGGTKEKVIGFSVLAISLLLFLFRRMVQDKETPHWREETPTMPDAHVAALLEEEMTPA